MEEVTVVGVVVLAVVWVYPVALSMRLLSWQIEREAKTEDFQKNPLHQHRPKLARSSTYRILLDAIGDALDDVLYHGTMVTLWFVVTKAHHAPMFVVRVPAHFDDAIIDLFAIGFQTG